MRRNPATLFFFFSGGGIPDENCVDVTDVTAALTPGDCARAKDRADKSTRRATSINRLWPWLQGRAIAFRRRDVWICKTAATTAVVSFILKDTSSRETPCLMTIRSLAGSRSLLGATDPGAFRVLTTNLRAKVSLFFGACWFFESRLAGKLATPVNKLEVHAEESQHTGVMNTIWTSMDVSMDVRGLTAHFSVHFSVHFFVHKLTHRQTRPPRRSRGLAPPTYR